jgi:precorrin-2 C20-methyltransferase/precorrin-3B C17-methyltransferase
MSGRLYGVGLGPGDPELVTVRAARLVGEADVIAFHSAGHGRSIARAIAAPYLRDGQLEEALVYPVTTGAADHPGGYAGAMEDFYVEAADRLAAHLEAGRTVVVLCEGDPSFYGSYLHLHERLRGRFDAEIVPGVTSLSAAAAAVGEPLVQADQTLTVLPGTLPPGELSGRLMGSDAAAIYKLGRTFTAVRQAVLDAGVLERAWYVERASSTDQRVQPLADVDPATVPYMSLVIVPGCAAVREQTAEPLPRSGSVTVVGLGPGSEDWTTPQVTAALAQATDLVGYGPYLARLPDRTGQTKHASDNRVEAERAAHALDLAATGRNVVVVSSGDPGVFAMASAVLEVVCDGGDRWADVAVDVLPGMTAAQAVSSTVGAPLGHDYCVISLSDRLKPWDIVETRLRAAAGADMCIAIYNPASKSRTWQVEAARTLLLEHRSPQTPVVIARDVGGADQNVTVVELGSLDPDVVDMRTMLVIGSSMTQVRSRPDGSTVVYTPRTYPGSDPSSRSAVNRIGSPVASAP